MSSGIDCVFEGFGLIRQPGLRRYVIIPLAINVLLLTGFVTWAVVRFEIWTDALTRYLPSWLSFLSWLIWILAAILVILVVLYLFTIVANIIAAPFNAVLSVKVEERLTGLVSKSEASVASVLFRSIARELGKLLYYLPRLIGLLIVSLIPGINAIAPALWILFGAWMMAVEYTDYAADNNEVSFSELRLRLGWNRVQALAFGMLVYFLLAIPFLNLVVIPAAVAGGTAFWVRRLNTR